MADTIDVQLTINGQEVRAQVSPDLSLMRFLRDQMGLTGAKDGCATGQCGACTVIVNGKATRSCLARMSKVEGAQVETIEGLAQDGYLHPIQESFVEHGAAQCGFCTPGMIMSAKALLDANPTPTADEIKKALTQNSNLCRCTGYVSIIAAIQSAAEKLATGEAPRLAMPAEGQPRMSVPVRDAVAKVTGTTRYVARKGLVGSSPSRRNPGD